MASCNRSRVLSAIASISNDGFLHVSDEIQMQFEAFLDDYFNDDESGSDDNGIN